MKLDTSRREAARLRTEGRRATRRQRRIEAEAGAWLQIDAVGLEWEQVSVGLEWEQALALATVVRGREAWSAAEDIEPETLGGLVELGWFELWERPDFEAVTLTTRAALARGLVINEQGRWVAAQYGDGGVLIPPKPALSSTEREVTLLRPELVEDHRGGPEVVIDPCDGEPLIMRGRVVPVDRRIKGKT